VGAAPQPGGQGLLLVGGRPDADDALVERGLSGGETVEGGTGQLAGIPGVIGADLWVADVGAGGRDENGAAEEQDRNEKGTRNYPRNPLSDLLSGGSQTHAGSGGRQPLVLANNRGLTPPRSPLLDRG